MTPFLRRRPATASRSIISAGWQEGPLGNLYRPRYFNSRDAIAVHGSGSIPPYPASHGCARVSTAAMDMIWARNLMPMGSRVVVY